VRRGQRVVRGVDEVHGTRRGVHATRGGFGVTVRGVRFFLESARCRGVRCAACGGSRTDVLIRY
jgi:hypothetical protein